MHHDEPISQAEHSKPDSDTVSESVASAVGGLTPAQLRALPAAIPFDPIVPKAFGISRSAAYRALAAGQLPITPLKIGRRLIVRRAELLAALSIPDTL